MDLTKMGMIQLQNPSHPTGLLCKANQMRLAGTLCDVVIMVDSQEFHAHRTVLACTSKMFEILFHRNSQHYTLDFLSPKTFQQILEYAYTATLQAKAEDLDDLLYAAEILEIEYLEEQCLKILETIQASDDNDTEATMADGGAEEEEDRKARYLKNIFISKHSSEESGYASVAAQSLPGPMVDQSPSVSTSFGLSAMSPTKAAVDSLMTIGQSLLQGALQPPAGPEEPTLAGGGRHPAVAEVKPEMMQVDEVPGQDSPGAAESSISAGMGDKVEERGKEGPGTPTRSSVITSARELHYGREESAEQLPPPTEAGQGPPGRPEPPAPPAEKHLGIYSVLPNHKADAVLSMPSSVTSGLHVQPTLAVSMDFSTYGGLLPQGFIQRELFSKLGELAVGMKSESRSVGEQCSVCGVELPDNEAVEQHRTVGSWEASCLRPNPGLNSSSAHWKLCDGCLATRFFVCSRRTLTSHVCRDVLRKRRCPRDSDPHGQACGTVSGHSIGKDVPVVFFLIIKWVLKWKTGVPVMAQWLTNPTRNHEVVGSIPGLAQRVKDPVFP
uniref:BTB domain-containing protein n=1 Tax=Sus scrofa TaxID=9823 RepID=A0A8D0TVQ5_PIG